MGQIADAPTLTQIQELMESCSSVWTTLNGVNGRMFTGPNGGQVFLPAAGCRLHDEFFGVGTDGGYWSGTPVEGYDYYAWCLYFYYEGVYWSRDYRSCGSSVRREAR